MIISQILLLKICIDNISTHLYTYETSSVLQGIDQNFINQAKSSLSSIIIVYFVSCVLELVFQIFGVSIVHLDLIFLQNVFHLLGVLFTIWFLLDAW